MGAIELEEVDKIVKERTVITDNSLYERVYQNAENTISYQQSDYPLGEILAEIAINKEKNGWNSLKPLYIQPPPVFSQVK